MSQGFNEQKRGDFFRLKLPFILFRTLAASRKSAREENIFLMGAALKICAEIDLKNWTSKIELGKLLT